MRQSDLIVKTLLGAKARMEKQKKKAANFKRQAQDANPINRTPAIKAMVDVRLLRNAKGDARKNIASDMVKMLLVKPKAGGKSFCTNCGAKLPPGISFCGDCGKKIQ